MKHLKHLNKYFLKYKFHLFFGVFFVAISNIFGVLSPQVIRMAFDFVEDNILFYRTYDGFGIQSDYYSFFSLALLIFGATVIVLALLKGGFMFLMRQTLIVMSRLIEFDLKNDMYAHYQKLDLAFYKRNNTGDLMSRIAEDVSRVRMYLGPALLYSINLIVLFAMVIYTMIRVNAELTFYVLLPLPILSISIYYVNTLINVKSEKIQAQLSRITTEAQEVYSGIRVIKSYAQEEQVAGKFEAEAAGYRSKSLDLARTEAFFFPLMMLLIGLSTILTIFIGGLQVIRGTITPGNIAEFVIYINMLTWPVAAIGWVASIIQRAAASQKRINEFLHTEPTIESPTEVRKVFKGDIEFKDVTLVYPDTGIKAIDHISFRINAGEKVAFIGRTGSGKSTIADLIVRMYDPTSGSITLDGKDLQELNLHDMRKQIGYVPQDVFLFSDTVSENIAFGTENKDQLHVEKAAGFAAIHDDIASLPKAYQTLVGERGVTLSGGQKQRISIARAFMKDPGIMILDDCLSAVDAKTEKRILGSLRELLEDKTALIITHRIFSLLNFDRIYVLDEGKIIESGKHEELLKKKGLYYDLYQTQQAKEKIKH